MKKICPTQQRVMELLSMAVIPEDRKVFRERFMSAPRDKNGKFIEAPVDAHGGRGDRHLCETPMSLIARAFECKPFNCARPPKCFPSMSSSPSSSMIFT